MGFVCSFEFSGHFSADLEEFPSLLAFSNLVDSSIKFIIHSRKMDCDVGWRC